MLRLLFDSLGLSLTIQKQVVLGFDVLLVLYLTIKCYKYFFGNLPPGPLGVPILGYLPFLTKNAHFKLMSLARKYGDVFSMRLGSEPVIVLSSADVIKEAFNKPEYLGRPPNSVFTLFKTESPFFSGNLETWQEQRRFVLQSMKNLGLGKSKIEEHITAEIKTLTECIKEKRGQPFDILPMLTASMSNNITALVFGNRYPYDHPDRVRLDQNIEEGSKYLSQTSVHIFFPWIKYFPFLLKLWNYDKGRECFFNNEEFFRSKLEAHKSVFDPNNVEDFIDSYIVEMKSRKEKDPNTTFNEGNLVGCVTDLFGAGTETVRSTIRWCLYIMAANPDVQKGVQREISEVLGTEKDPEFKDQREMPYTHAVLMEVQRWRPVVPLNLLRYTLGETVVGGHTIPDGVIVMANFHAVHHDPRIWKDPETFNPDRFLSPDRSTVVKSGDLMTFSVGKRACPGENMANMEVFLYFVTLLQKFDVRFPTGYSPDFDAELTITYRLKPYDIRLIARE